jgi:flagellar basal body-associated protein FliL
MRTPQQEKPMKKIIAIVAIVLAALGVAGVVYAKTND